MFCSLDLGMRDRSAQRSEKMYGGSQSDEGKEGAVSMCGDQRLHRVSPLFVRMFLSIRVVSRDTGRGAHWKSSYTMARFEKRSGDNLLLNLL